MLGSGKVVGSDLESRKVRWDQDDVDEQELKDYNGQNEQELTIRPRMN
jgi:hypothetical protein